MDNAVLLKYKRQVMLGIGCILLLGLGLILFLTRPGSVTIQSEAGSEIFVSTSKGGYLQKIGDGSAKFSTRDLPTSVYVVVTKDGKKTVSGTELKRGDNKSMDLKISGTTEARKIADGSMINVYFQGNSGQGIIPGEYVLTSFRTDRYEPTKPELVGIPYVKKVIWYGPNTFIYSSFNEGIGRFIDNQLLFNEGLATTISGKDLNDIDPENGQDGSVSLIDVDRSGERPTVFLSNSNLFLSDDLGTNLRSITGFKSSKHSNQSLFATNNHIYRFIGEDPAAYADESDSAEATESEHGGSLYKYSYSGEQLAVYEIDSESVVSVAERSDTTYILTKEKLMVASGEDISEIDLYFNYARDLVEYKGRVVMLGDDGLWQIANDGISIQLVYEFKGSGVGLAGSFSVSGDSLIFGTQPRPEDTEDNSKMFAITF